MRGAEFFGVFLLIKNYEILDPIQLRMDCTAMEASHPHVVLNGLEKSRWAMEFASSLKHTFMPTTLPAITFIMKRAAS